MLQLSRNEDAAKCPIETRKNSDDDCRSSKETGGGGGVYTTTATRSGTDFDILNSDLVYNLVEFYFANIHHWIPILHVRKFREQIQSDKGRQKAIYILHAIVALCSRFSDDGRLGSDVEKAKLAEKSRQKVILSSMESFSVENLQALVIIAFGTVS